ncbi:unnamed protein product [Spirodela intermedia]|uniref:RRM domain-containing protein n=1 Tax=Spirodela intermedia TaxID=51605 RepID=A0A7I8LA52_SPIIN|nr:unnamed protein product [Spirodela intermedia]
MATKRKSEAEPEFAAEDEDTGEDEEELEELEEDEEDAEEGRKDRSDGNGGNGDDEDGEEEGDEESRRQSVRKLLEPFGKDQLIDFLKEAAARNPSVIRNISEAAESDPVHRKIFVHGLGWDATTEILADTFRLYGEIEKCNVVMDKATGKSKGFGFVLFCTRAGAQNALKQPQKKIGNRTTSCQLACFGPATDSANRKIYVTNVAPDVNPERLRSFFEKFGEIEEAQLGHDQTRGKSKGHAFFTYRTPEGCRKALEEPMKVFEGCQLHCKKAFEHWKAKTPSPMGGFGASAVLQPNDLALMYAPSSLMGLVGQKINPAAALVGHSPGLGVLHSVAAAGLSPSGSLIGTAPPSSYGAAYGSGGGGIGVNSLGSSVIGNYSPAALQGLGSYQSPHLTLTSDLRYMGTGLPPYLGR